MKICPCCGSHVGKIREMQTEFKSMKSEFGAMGVVIAAAEDLVDIASTDADTEDVAAAGTTLAEVVKGYRRIAKRFEPKGEENAVQ
jgi:hypothetical protein